MGSFFFGINLLFRISPKAFTTNHPERLYHKYECFSYSALFSLSLKGKELKIKHHFPIIHPWKLSQKSYSTSSSQKRGSLSCWLEIPFFKGMTHRKEIQDFWDGLNKKVYWSCSALLFQLSDIFFDTEFSKVYFCFSQGELAEWSNAVVSKTIFRCELEQGFESLTLRLRLPKSIRTKEGGNSKHSVILLAEP